MSELSFIGFIEFSVYAKYCVSCRSYLLKYWLSVNIGSLNGRVEILWSRALKHTLYGISTYVIVVTAF